MRSLGTGGFRSDGYRTIYPGTEDEGHTGMKGVDIIIDNALRLRVTRKCTT